MPCLDGLTVPLVELDQAASTHADPAAAAALRAFLPVHVSDWSRLPIQAGHSYESARRTVLSSRPPMRAPLARGPDVAIFCPDNTTEALNHRPGLPPARWWWSPDDVVVTTVVEHHANLLPWGRVATRR